MLEYSKEILTKVSFDPVLFKKELQKAMMWLKGEQRTLLLKWCAATFGASYGEVISSTMKELAD
ncbi:MAG: hypothetical protein ACK5C5_04735 [Bacteroidota bacterium]|jgi:hypothetical protein